MEEVLFSPAAKAALVFAWFALFFGLERLVPAAPPAPAARPLWRRWGRNGVLWLANVGLSLAVVLPVTAWAATVDVGLRPAWWQGPWGLLLDLVLLDFLIYWWHRLNHVVPLLWRFHEVHHLDRFLDTTSAVRFHFGEVLLSALARAAVIIAFGIPFESVIVFETLILVAALFHHSDVRLPRGLEAALARVIITPSIHWVHHHRVRADTDSNYGTVFSFWDRLFATRSRTPRTPDMPIGVQGREERPLVGLLLSPFAARG